MLLQGWAMSDIMWAMPNALHILIVTARVLAFVLGCISLYLAFFLYEDEEGKLQNRIEKLWVTIDDRAKATNSITTAVLNSVAKVLRRLFNVMFGESYFSAQLLSVSINMSVAGASISFGAFAYGWERLHVTATEAPLSCLAIGVIFLAQAAVVIRYPRHWVILLCCLPIVFSLASVLYLVLFLAELIGRQHIVGFFASVVIAIPSALCYSIASDIMSVIAIRRIFASAAKSWTPLEMLKSIGLLGGVLYSFVLCPAYIGFRFLSSRNQDISDISMLLVLFEFLNVTNVFYCALLMCVFVLLLLHKAIWPVLSRMIYPISRYKLLLNRKVMVSSGCLALTFAFNVERVGFKQLLELLSK
jgi:hypothetical protein